MGCVRICVCGGGGGRGNGDVGIDREACWFGGSDEKGEGDGKRDVIAIDDWRWCGVMVLMY